MPEQIGSILSDLSNTKILYQIEVDRIDCLDKMSISIEVSEKIFFDEMREQREFVDGLQRAITDLIGFSVSIRLVEPGSFDRNQTVIDKRKKRGS